MGIKWRAGAEAAVGGGAGMGGGVDRDGELWWGWGGGGGRYMELWRKGGVSGRGRGDDEGSERT